MSTDLLSFEHPSVLLFCSLEQLKLKADTTTKPKVDMSEFEVNLLKKWGNPDPESIDLLYGGHPDMSLLFMLDIGKTYKMMHNNGPA